MKKKITAFVIALCACLSATVLSACSFSPAKFNTVEGVKYAINGDPGWSTAGMEEPKTQEIEISSKINGIAVTRVGSFSFAECKELKSVKLPNSITRIERYGFSECTALTDITLPKGITQIDESAFWNCDSLTSITIPDTVTKIGKGAFADCDNLIVLCEVKSKPEGWDDSWNKDSASDKCRVVWDCNNNDKDEEGYAYVTDNNIRYKVKDGKASVIKNDISLSGNITIPSVITYKQSAYNVVGIDNFAFKECKGITSVTFEQNSKVETIGGSAFANCTGITSVTFGENCSLNRIGSYAFSGCATLAGFVVPEGVESIGSYAFQECENLATVTLPNTLKSIEEKAFDVTNDIQYCGTKAEWNAIDKHLYWMNSNPEYKVTCVDGVTR